MEKETRALLAPLVLSLLWLSFSGCAQGFTSTEAADFGTFRIDVTNDLAPRARVYLQSNREGPAAAAEGIFLGDAPVEGTTVFRIDIEDPRATYRLRVQLPRDREVTSEPFVPAEVGPGLHWTLSDNVLTRGSGVREEAPDEDAGDLEAAPSSEERGVSGTRGGLRRPTGSRLLPRLPRR